MERTGLILDAESISELVELGKGAEDAKFDSVWATELYRTSFQQLSAVAQATQTIKLGTAVALAFVRSPRIKECIEVIRLIMNKSHLDDPVSFNGDYYNINTRGYHRPFKPLRSNIPIYLAAVGKYMAQAAGEVADGYLGHVVCSLRYIKDVVNPNIKSGLERSRRSRKDFDLASIITCAVSNNESEAKQAARATIAFYATVRTYEPPFKMHGFEKEAQKIREAFFKRDIKSMIENVTDDMVETFAIVGDADECLKRINEYREYIDLPILSAPHYFLDFDEVKEYQRAILETFGK